MSFNLITKKGCGFCEVLKDALDSHNVDYTTTLITNGTAPKLYHNGELIFTGLPSHTELEAFLRENN